MFLRTCFTDNPFVGEIDLETGKRINNLNRSKESFNCIDKQVEKCDNEQENNKN